MTWEMLIIGAVRVAGSLPVLRWAFAGGVVAVLVDLSDLFLLNLIDLGGVGDYQRFDKIADVPAMLAFLAVALRWRGPPRDVAVVLFGFRAVGFAVFVASGDRNVLPLFPNVFEFWFLFVAGQRQVRPGFAYTRRQIVAVGLVLLAAKGFQEYALHWGRWLDGFTAVEAVEAIAGWVTAPLC